MAAPHRPAVTGQFWDQAQLASGPALYIKGLKKGERRTEEKEKMQVKKRLEGGGHGKGSPGVH